MCRVRRTGGVLAVNNLDTLQHWRIRGLKASYSLKIALLSPPYRTCKGGGGGGGLSFKNIVIAVQPSVAQRKIFLFLEFGSYSEIQWPLPKKTCRSELSPMFGRTPIPLSHLIRRSCALSRYPTYRRAHGALSRRIDGTCPNIARLFFLQPIPSSGNKVWISSTNNRFPVTASMLRSYIMRLSHLR
jgi:hypothetical protein